MAELGQVAVEICGRGGDPTGVRESRKRGGVGSLDGFAGDAAKLLEGRHRHRVPVEERHVVEELHELRDAFGREQPSRGGRDVGGFDLELIERLVVRGGRHLPKERDRQREVVTAVVVARNLRLSRRR